MIKVKRENISIVLVEPQIPENIGAVARAMNNMDIRKLILVSPKNDDMTRILKTATLHSVHIVDCMEVHRDLNHALGPFEYIVGTTARIGDKRPPMTNPRNLARELISISQENAIAILFGPEDRGLSNEQLRFCHTITTIPTTDFSSLNLSQAVMVICYEIFTASEEAIKEVVPRLADSFELEGMYAHLRSVLMKIGFLNPQNPEHWMMNIRRFFSRLRLRARETRIIRGICRQIDWYTGQVEKMLERENDKTTNPTNRFLDS